uniref:Uncharacterized protein n=1 Tax=uncultured prokaryote TaxID=198431 RepID=A0A0H5Q3L2_9ZZZZ|nr:hypothetical protein [uncultured prokaryote]
MPSSVAEGAVQATYVMTHPQVANNFVVTMGHSIFDRTGGLQGTVDRLHRDFAEAILPQLDGDVTFQYVDMYVGAGTSPSGSIRSTEPPEGGGTTANTLPANCALLVSKRTALLSRKGKGRIFLPFVTAEDKVNEGGIIDASVMDDYQATMDLWTTASLREGADGDGPVPMVINPSADNPNVAAAPIAITRLVVSNKIATQRRRLRR